MPTGLRTLGYEDQWIDYRFRNQDLEEVVPDLVIASRLMRHTAMLEWKSGANTEPDQLRRYSGVSEDDLRSKLQIDAEASKTHDVAVVCQSCHADRVRMGIENGGYPFPLVVAGSPGLSLQLNQFQVQELNALFSPLLEVNLETVPTSFVPCDAESELWEVAEVVLPLVIEFMSMRTPRISLETLCDRACITWNLMGPEPKAVIKRKIAAVLEEAAGVEFAQHLRWTATGRDSGRLEITSNPLDIHSSKRTTAYQRLQSYQRKLLSRLGKGGGIQLRLFR